MVATLVGNHALILFTAIAAPCAFAVTFYLLAHEPRARRLHPGHPAWDGEADDEE